MGVKTFTHKSPGHSQELLDKLNALRSEGRFCDVSIRVQGQVFSAHKVVLACCSDFLKTKLSGKPGGGMGEGEGDKAVLDLHHVTVAGFAPLLEYAYTSTLSISTENIIDVLAAASYMQMFAVANTCSEFMKSSILWNSGGTGAGAAAAAATTTSVGSVLSAGFHRPQEAPEGMGVGMGGGGGGGAGNCPSLAPVDALSPSPVSSECSMAERPAPTYRESRRKRKGGFASPQPSASSSSPQVPNPSPSSSSFPESSEPSLASSFAWTYPFGMERRYAPDKAKGIVEGLLVEAGGGGGGVVGGGVSGQDQAGRALVEYLGVGGAAVMGVTGVGVTGVGVGEEEEDDVQVKVERLSDSEVHEEASQPVSASHSSSLSDQQTVPGSEHAQEDLLISPQSSSIGSMDEGVAEGLQSIQGTPNTTGHMEEDERLENVQYPYHLYISPSTRPGINGPERPFQCPTCGVRFTRIQNLKQHMLIHSGIKPFQCDRCGKKFTRAYSLKMHRLKHEGKRCFQCQICRATFTSFGEYKHHMRVSRHVVRKPRIYECKTCGAMFTNSGNLIVHLRSLNHEASELANYFQTSEFLLPDYLSHVQQQQQQQQQQEEDEEEEEDESLAHFHIAQTSFHPSSSSSSSSSSSVQTPVISQVSSTINYEPHPYGPPPTPPLPGPNSAHAVEAPKSEAGLEEEHGGGGGGGEKEEADVKNALVSITIE